MQCGQEWIAFTPFVWALFEGSREIPFCISQVHFHSQAKGPNGTPIQTTPLWEDWKVKAVSLSSRVLLHFKTQLQKEVNILPLS